jgi:hypothetical protein
MSRTPFDIESLRQPHYLVAALMGAIKPTLTNDLRFGCLRDWWCLPGVLPSPQVPGIDGAIEPAGGASAYGGLLDGPVDCKCHSKQTVDRLIRSQRDFTT